MDAILKEFFAAAFKVMEEPEWRKGIYRDYVSFCLERGVQPLQIGAFSFAFEEAVSQAVKAVGRCSFFAAICQGLQEGIEQ